MTAAALTPGARDRRLTRTRIMVDIEDARIAAQVRAALVRDGARLLDSGTVLGASSWDSTSCPQLYVADLRPETLELSTMLRRLCGTTSVFVLQSFESDLLREAAEADAACVVTTPLDARQLDVALQFAAHRHYAGPPRHAEKDTVLPARVNELLRPRERDVVTLLLQHHRVPAIAQALGIRPQTVRNHLKRIFKQTNTRSQQDLLDWLRDGALAPGSRGRGVPLRPSREVSPSRLLDRGAHEGLGSSDGSGDTPPESEDEAHKQD